MTEMEDMNILAENIIKIEKVKEEQVDSIGECTLNFIVKQEPDNYTGEQIEDLKVNSLCSSQLVSEVGETCSLKREIKEQDDEEEELQPPVRIFLNSEEVIVPKIEQEQEDPLAMCTKNFDDIRTRDVGGECDTTDTCSEWQIRMRNTFGKNGIIIRGNVTLNDTGVKATEIGACNKISNIEQHFSKSNNIMKVPERSVCDQSVPQSVHVTVVWNGVRYECPRCRKIFSSREDFARHVQITSGECPLECFICHKTYSRTCTLVSHLKIHRSERPYECSVCQETFSQRKYLMRHQMRVHRGERPYKCSICQNCYSYNYHLMKHMRIHKGESP